MLKIVTYIMLSILSATATGCSIGSKGQIIVADSTSHAVEDEIALMVAGIAVKHGFAAYPVTAKYQGPPCTMERGCIWVHHDHEPVIAISGTAQQGIRIDIESRNIVHDERVKRVTEELAARIKARLPTSVVTIKAAY